MGVWGACIEENDTFCEIQDIFWNKTEHGDSPLIVAHEILEEYSQNPDINNVYFALANCLWNCGIKQDVIFDKVFFLIDNHEDLQLWKINGANLQLLQQRAAELKKFKQKIKTVPPIKPDLPFIEGKKEDLQLGDVFIYKSLKKYYGGIIINIQTLFDENGSDNYYLIGISEALAQKTNHISDILKTALYTVAWFSDVELLPSNRVQMIGRIYLEKHNLNGRAGFLFQDGRLDISNCGQRLTWQHKYRALYLPSRSMKDVTLEKNLPKYYPDSSR